jgi:hypothetical protein
MNRQILLLALLSACSDRPAETNASANVEADAPAVQVAAPAGAPLSGHEQILGAIDGPCGSTMAQEYLGKSWVDDTSAAMKEKTGAEEVKLFRFNAVADPHEKMNEHRLNVYLSPSGRIVHLVCG